jgi:hypothetical protein
MAFDLVEDIALLIEAVLTTVTIKAELPPDTSNCIAVIPSGGFPPTHTFGGTANQKPAYIEPSFQILCRHESLDTMKGWWDSIRGALDGKVNYTPSGTSRTYLSIMQSGDIMPLGRDDNRRHIQSLNFNAMIIGSY